MRPTTTISYRPALDGLRAVAIVAVLLFHLNPAWARGGWLGVDLFFALSGYLITTLLLSERARTGAISLPSFWLARLRRLLPSLVTVLIAVLAASYLLAESGRRGAISKDVVASLFYVVNWRFIRGDEQYFSDLGLPSPVRHLWSLSIEEQFYVLFPILLVTLIAILRKRWLVLAALVLVAALSATLMGYLYSPGQDVSRIYYGTDTRMFELLIGASAAIAFHKFSWKDFPGSKLLLEALAWFGLVVSLLIFATLTADHWLPFPGGLTVLCLAAIPMFLAATSTTKTTFARVLGFAPIRGLGLISYALYLWHWPVIVFGMPRLKDLPIWAAAPLLAAVSITLAWLTYRYIEVPIRTRRLRGLVPGWPWFGRAIAWGFVPTVLVLAHITTLGPSPTAAAKTDPDDTVQLVPPVYRPEAPTHAVLLGNSIPASLYAGLPTGRLAGFELNSVTNFGCDPFPGERIVNGAVLRTSDACLRWKDSWEDHVAQLGPDIILFFVPQSLVMGWVVDGQSVDLGDPKHDDFIRSSLDSVRSGALAAGADIFTVSTLACHDLLSHGNDDAALVNDIERVKHLREITLAWAQNTQTPVIDTFDALCADGYKSGLNGVPLYSDGFHYTAESAPIVWDWMRPQLEEIADQSRHD